MDLYLFIKLILYNISYRLYYQIFKIINFENDIRGEIIKLLKWRSFYNSFKLKVKKFNVENRNYYKPFKSSFSKIFKKILISLIKILIWLKELILISFSLSNLSIHLF